MKVVRRQAGRGCNFGEAQAPMGLGMDEIAGKVEAPGDLGACGGAATCVGVFGAPYMVIDNEPFWGNDRVSWLAKKLDDMGLRR